MWKEKLKHGLSVHFGIQMIHVSIDMLKFLNSMKIDFLLFLSLIVFGMVVCGMPYLWVMRKNVNCHSHFISSFIQI